MTPPFQIGVVGYSSTPFDTAIARQILRREISQIAIQHIFDEIDVVSGLTAIGIPLLAYETAVDLKLRTVGIACAKAREYPCWPCDEVVIVGEDWGDESATFLSRINFLLKVGGGKQSAAEFAAFRGPKKDVPLPPLPG